VPTPIGRVWLAARPSGLVRVELPGPNAELRLNVWLALHFPMASKRNGVSPILKKACAEIEAYFTAGLTQFTVPYELVGTAFQIDVWRKVAAIRFGETTSYREIASAIGNTRAVRAVGNAQNANPVPILVPCHRVIGSNGNLTGYAGGLELKQWLLEHEAARSKLSSPTPRPLRLIQVPRVNRQSRPSTLHHSADHTPRPPSSVS